MASIPLRTKGTFTLLVAPQHLANQFKDATLPPVLATPVGQRIVAEAEVTGVDRRWIAFKVVARDEVEGIGHGTHERVLVALSRIEERLAAKSRG
jgi:fluoroacetyl-CoA thioesterase